ncbi:MAG: hypothetical protein ACTSQE_07440 [Candidatus Heimdallarchaeaceae archaeon]
MVFSKDVEPNSSNRGKEFLILSLSSLGLLAISFLAFSKKSKKEIGNRDKWTCVDCHKQFKDGWMVHASHNSNSHHKGPHYDKPESGAIRCVDCHQEQHELGTSLGELNDSRAVNLLKHQDRVTRKFKKTGKSWW